MKKGTIVAFLFLLVLSCQADKKFRTLSVEDFSSYISEDSVQLVDVRTLEEFEGGHLKDAILMDVKGDSFENLANSQLDKKQKVAVYCRSGKRSAEASQKLIDLGFEQVVDLDGGYSEWTNQKKPIAMFDIVEQ